MKKSVVLLLALVLGLSLCACGGNGESKNTEPIPEVTMEVTTEAATEPTQTLEEQEAQTAAEYHESMAVALESDKENAVVANKAVAYVEYAGNATLEEHDPAVYCRQYIPAELIAETPEEVCFVIRCVHDAKVVGQYTYAGAMVGDKAYQRTLTIAVEDRFTGEVMRETEILGDEPPETIQAGDSHYGPYPDEAEVSQWIAEAVAEATERRQEKAIEHARYLVEIYHRSREGLIEILSMYDSSNYTIPEAEYAADNCGADWSQTALLCLQEGFVDPDSFIQRYDYRSYNGVIYYLTYYEGFTEEQAVYAAENSGMDWKEQAVIVAEAFKDWDRDSAIYIMTDSPDTGGCGFTMEEAIYAADYYGLK